MNINDIIDTLRQAQLYIEHRGHGSTEQVCKVTTDSRGVGKGDIFIAYQGVNADGHQYIDSAIKQGAAYIVLERKEALSVGTAANYILVRNAREAWAYIEACRHGNPQNKIKFIGITGTNGKTSSVWMIRQMLDKMGLACMSIGTLGIQVGEKTLITNHTTPDPDILFAQIAEAVHQGVPYIAMEVSSHSLEQKKLGPIRFCAAGFTSFSQDHLDYHLTMEHYLAAKQQLFTHYLADADTLICLHESVAHLLAVSERSDRLCIYGEGDFKAAQLPGNNHVTTTRFFLQGIGPRGTKLKVMVGDTPHEAQAAFFGNVFLANFAGALTIVEQLTKKQVPTTVLEQIKPVPGRLEPVRVSDHQPGVFVDYAHTPDALEKVLKIARGFCEGQLWGVFGCGGDRDRKKRPLMATLTEQLADRVVVTSDNPRTEDPHNIIADILAGLKQQAAAHVIENREEAISYAIKHAKADDLIIIAGKGHEDYQIIGKTKTHFDDREIARKYLHKYWQNVDTMPKV